MKHGHIAWIFCILALLSGCGHSVLIESEITGIALRVPIGEAGHLGFILGSTKTTTATVRGGTTLETTSSSGGGIFSGDGGINRITTFKTNAQLNEGNLRDVLVSDNVPAEAKVALASNLCVAAKAPKVAPTVLQTPSTTIHTGEATLTNDVGALNRISGVDKLVNTIPSVVTPVTDTISNVSTGIVNNAVNGVIGTVTEITGQVTDGVTETISDTAKIVNDTKWMTLIKWLGIIIVSVLTIWYGKSKGLFGKSSKGNSDDPRPNPVMRPVDPDKVVTDEGSPPVKPTPVDNTPPAETASPPPKKEEEKKSEVKKEEEPPKTPWYKKVITFFSVLWALFMRIPPEKRKQGFDFLKKLAKEWIEKKRAEKKVKKSE